MKLWTLLLLALAIKSVYAKEVDLSAPQGSLGSANSEGAVRWFTDIAEFNLGKVALPVRLDFSSNRHSISPYGGWGFECGLMQAKAILVREKLMRVDLICSKVMYLKRNNTDPTKFQTLNGEWRGELREGQFEVSRNDGWRLVFRGENGGRIHEIRTDEGKTLTWVYAGDTPVQLREGGKVVLDAQLDEQGKLIKRLTVGGVVFDLTYANRPVVKELQGTRLIDGFHPALASVVSSAGPLSTYAFEVRNSDLTPTLTLSDALTKSKTIGWTPTTNRIAFEDDWTYEVSNLVDSKKRPEMTRTSSAGVQEAYHFDNASGTITYINGEGLKTVTKLFRIAGPLYDKVRLVEKGNRAKTTPVYRASYDETGKLIRHVDEGGVSSIFKWTKSGQLESITRAKAVVLTRQYDDKGRLILEDIPAVKKTEIAYGENGSRALVVTKNGTSKKAVEKAVGPEVTSVNVSPPISAVGTEVVDFSRREEEVAKLMLDLSTITEPRARGEHLIYIAQRFSSDSRWPMDAKKSLELYRSILAEYSSDPVIALKARSWIATVLLHNQDPEQAAIEELKAALAIDGEALAASDRASFAAERGACFRRLLMLSTTGNLDKDLLVLEELKKQYQKTEKDEKAYRDAVGSVKETKIKKLLRLVRS